MSHARKSLESLLAKPGKRRNVGSHEGGSYFRVVQQLFTDIEAYRNRGYSLGEIYGALLRGGDIGCTLSTFKTYYYRLKQLADNSVLKGDDKHQRVGLSQSAPVTNQGFEYSVRSECIDDASSCPVVEAVDQASPSTPVSDKQSLLDISDAEIEAQQALAKRMFAQRRAELGITRRED